MEIQRRDEQAEAVLRGLDHEDPQVRRQGVIDAVKLSDRAVKVIPKLQQLAADDPSTEVRFIAKKALTAFAQISSPSQKSQSGRKSAGATKLFALEPVDALKVKLASPDVNIRASALRAAALKQDKSVIPALISRIPKDQETDPELRALGCRIIAILGGAQQAEGIARYLQDPDPRVRSTAVEVLAQLQSLPAFAFVAQALQDSEHSVVSVAATALKSLGAPNILRLATAMLKSSVHTPAAIYLLAMASIPESVPLLEGAINDASPAVRNGAIAGLRRLASAGVQAAKNALQNIEIADKAEVPAPEPTPEFQLDDIASPDRHARRRATRAIVDLDTMDESLLPTLLSRLKVETDAPTIANLLAGVSRIKDKQVLGAVKEFLQHGNPGVRAGVANALGAIGTDDALNSAVPLLQDEDPNVVGRAILVLKNHPFIDIGKALEALATKPDPKFRCSAVFTVSLLGDRKHRQLLDKLAQDSDGSVSDAAKDAIGLVDYGTVINPYESAARTARSTGKHRAVDEPSADEVRIADLKRQLDSPLPAERDAALSALADYSHLEEVRNIFRDRSETDKDPDVRFHARQVYTSAGTLFSAAPVPEVLEYAKASRTAGTCDRERLKALLAHESPAARLQALSATMPMEEKGMVDLLAPFLSACYVITETKRASSS